MHEDLRAIHKKWDALDKSIEKLIIESDEISPASEREARRRLAIYVELSCELLAITQKLDALQSQIVQALLRAGAPALAPHAEIIN
jgi:hypothetical protein